MLTQGPLIAAAQRQSAAETAPAPWSEEGFAAALVVSKVEPVVVKIAAVDQALRVLTAEGVQAEPMLGRSLNWRECAVVKSI